MMPMAQDSALSVAWKQKNDDRYHSSYRIPFQAFINQGRAPQETCSAYVETSQGQNAATGWWLLASRSCARSVLPLHRHLRMISNIWAANLRVVKNAISLTTSPSHIRYHVARAQTWGSKDPQNWLIKFWSHSHMCICRDSSDWPLWTALSYV